MCRPFTTPWGKISRPPEKSALTTDMLTRTLLLFLWLAATSPAWSQKCVPSSRPADSQVVLPNGDVVVLATEYNGGLMDVFAHNKSIWVNSVRLSHEGLLLRDTTMALPWPEWHYDFFDCKANYRDKGASSLGDAASREHCSLYMPYVTADNQLVVGYYLLNDPRFAFQLAIDAAGQAKGNLLDPHGSPPFANGLDKYRWVSFQLTRQSPALARPPRTPLLMEPAGSIRLKDFPEVVLAPSIVDSIAARQAHRPASWVVRGPHWQLPLAGFLTTNNPLVNVAGSRLYLTVIRAQPHNCLPDNDYWPVVYCIDLNQHKILWQHSMAGQIYSRY